MIIKEQKICEKFCIEGSFESAVPYGSGHINDTRLVTTKTESGKKQYILQRINHNVFKKPDILMKNYVGVTDYLGKMISEAGGDPLREP